MILKKGARRLQFQHTRLEDFENDTFEQNIIPKWKSNSQLQYNIFLFSCQIRKLLAWIIII